jgi:lysophospholipase L1-like esterase
MAEREADIMKAFAVFLMGLFLAGTAWAGPAKWEKAIARFEAEDRENPPPEKGVLFVGSSSIVMWKRDKWFPDLPAFNRGFGGSTIADVIHFADRIVLPYRPETIVFYSGDNDIAGGMKAAEVAADFRRFAARVRRALPETAMLVIGIKPGTARWKLYPEMRKANALIEKKTENDPKLHFIAIEEAMLNEDGTPREDLLLEDGLHMNDAGYRIWTGLVREKLDALEKAEKDKKKGKAE